MKIRSFATFETVARILNWALIPTLPLFVSNEVIGEIAFFYALMIVMSTILGFSYNRIILGHNALERPKYTIYGVLISSILALSIFLTIHVLNITFRNSIYLIIVSLLYTIHLTFNYATRSSNDLFSFATSRVFYTLSRFILVLVLLQKAPNVLTYIIIEIYALSIVVIYQAIRFIKKIDAAKLSDFSFKDNMKSMYSALPLFVMISVNMILLYGDRIYAGWAYDMETVGVYTIVQTFVLSTSFIAAIFALEFEHAIYQAPRDQVAASQTKLFLTKTFALSVPFLIVCGIFLYFTSGFYLKKEFDVVVFVVLAAYTLFSIMFSGISYYATYMRQTKSLMLGSLIGVCTFLLMIFFVNVNKLSIIYVALSKLVSVFIICLTVTILMKYKKLF